MPSSRTVTVALHTRASIGHIIGQLSDLPTDMELVDIITCRDNFGYLAVTATFEDREGL